MDIHRSVVRLIMALMAFTFLGLGTASAQPDCSSSGPFIVLSLAGDSGMANKAIAFTGGETQLRSLLDLYAPMTKPRPFADHDALLFSAFKSSLPDGNSRWITRKGDPIAIYVIYDTSKETGDPNVEVTEMARKTQFALNLETLAKLAEKIGGLAIPNAALPPGQQPLSTIVVDRQCRTLVNLRSTLTATATATADPKVDAAMMSPLKASTVVITGPKEHAFISADLAVNSVKEVKLESGELVPKDNPSQFYVGFDYMLGDVLAETNTFPDGLTFKALVEASKDPTHSYGVALGIRFKNVNLPGISLDTFSPFAGYFWTRNDTLTGHKYKGDWRAGISLNLDKALNWVK
jgi:hypothetical protein